MNRGSIGILMAFVLAWVGCAKKQEAPEAASLPGPGTNAVAPKSPAREAATNAVDSISALKADYETASDLTDKLRVINTIADQDSREALDLLSELLQTEPDVELREAMLNTMPTIQSVDVVPAIAASLEPTQPTQLRLTGIEVLMLEDKPAAIPYLEQLLKDSNPTVREKAQKAIERINMPRISEAHREKLRTRIRKARQQSQQPTTSTP